MANRQNKCFISLIVEALAIKRKFKLYTLEKKFAKAGNNQINKCLCTKFSGFYTSVFGSSNPGIKKNGLFERFLNDDSTENYILKSVFGFIGGILLTYICFMFLVFSLNFTLKRATYICTGLGIVLSLGLAFSIKIRCTVFLCIPQLFSKRGRQALLAYAFILALSGPAKNTLHNVEVMSESLACGQEQIKQAENELLKCVQKPNAAAKKSIEKLLEKINSAVKYFKNFILQLYRNCFDILETVLHAQKWLYSISLLCHKKMGRPTQRCLNLLSEASETCESIDRWKIWKKTCFIKPRYKEFICRNKGKATCLRSDVPQNLPVQKLKNQLNDFKLRAMNILYVKIEAHQTYSQWNRSNAYHEEYQGMATEIRQKTDQFLQYFDFMSVIFGIFILVLFIKVIIYRHRFLTEDHFDNRFITSDFEDIDTARAEFRMETLLPLEPREKLKFIKVSSIRLVPCERLRLVSSFVFLIFATFKIIIHMLTDSSLYWILSTVRREERLLYMSSIREQKPGINIRVEGDGTIAALFRNITRAIKRQSTAMRLDPTPCLPDPVPPDWNRYYQILALVLICWLLALCEPYGLRLRHTVMVTYHPDRARERAIWLYNRIISNRTSFVKIARRELRRKYKGTSGDPNCSFQFMRKKASLKCLLCKVKVCSRDNYIKCSTSNCVGLYCRSCFASLKFCSICCDPTEYGEFSDLSEEKDSSEEEELCKCKENKKTFLNPCSVDDKNKLKKNTDALYLNFKKSPNFLNSSVKLSKKGNNEKLLQPVLFMRAVNYVMDKIPALRKQKDLAEVESSDWDFDSPIFTDDSSADDQFRFGAQKRRKALHKKKVEGKKNSAKLIKTKKSKNCNFKGIKKTKLIRKIKFSEEKFEKPESGIAIRLFKKISSPESLKKSEVEKRPKPDFLFKKIEKGAEGDFDDYRPATFLKAKDSLEQIKRSPKFCMKKINSKSLSAGDLINTGDPQNNWSEFATADNVRPGSLSYIKCYELEDKNWASSRSSKNEIFPFVDPDTIYKFNSNMDLPEITPSNAKMSLRDNFDKKSSTSFAIQSTTPKINPSPSRARICHKKTDSSDSAPESQRICLREDIATSSVESGCQFYSQSYHSSIFKLEPTKTNSNLERTKGKLNLKTKPSKYSKFYSIETDSSNEKFLSVKPAHRAKLVRFLKRNMKRKTSSEEENSDTDDVEYLPNMTFWLSNDEFQKCSQKSNEKGNERNLKKKSKNLSWASDLLSDLP